MGERAKEIYSPPRVAAYVDTVTASVSAAFQLQWHAPMPNNHQPYSRPPKKKKKEEASLHYESIAHAKERDCNNNRRQAASAAQSSSKAPPHQGQKTQDWA